MTAVTGAGPVCVRKPTSTSTACRCDSCRARNRRLRKLYEAGLVPPNPVPDAWERLAVWAARSWSPEAVGSATGLSARTVDELLVEAREGRTHSLHRHTVRSILSAGTPTTGRVGVHGTARRLQGLAAMGWALDDLAEVTGLAASTLSVMRSGARRYTSAAGAARVAEAYEVLHMRRGPSPDAAARAVTAGWQPPLVWDEDTIDDPAAVPVGAAPVARRGARQVVVEDVEELIALYPTITTRQLAERFGVGSTAVQHHLSRYGRQDLLDVLNRNAVLVTGHGREMARTA